MGIQPRGRQHRLVEGIAVALGQVIRQRRLSAKLTQEELAERSGLHWTYVSQIERGERNPSVDVLVRIGDALEAPGWQLLKAAQEIARGE